MKFPISPSTLLEIERKFAPTPRSLHLFRNNRGIPAFETHFPLGATSFTDTYYDLPSSCYLASRLHTRNPPGAFTVAERAKSLCASGIWVRVRDGVWQAKLNRGGSFTNSRFQEVEGMEAVGRVLRSFVDHGLDVRAAFGDKGAKSDSKSKEPLLNQLQKVAQFETTRERWGVDEGYEVVIDQTPFGWIGGEVEKVMTVKKGDEETRIAKKIDVEMEEFMNRFDWAFPVKGVVIGKMTAYFDWLREKRDVDL